MSPDIPLKPREFLCKVVGVTEKNSDGSFRQQILFECREGERVSLVREPDNTFDPCAIAVHRKNGQMLGYLPGGDFLLARHIDSGNRVEAIVQSLYGDRSPFEPNHSRHLKAMGCCLQILKYEPDWEMLQPLIMKNQAILDKIRATRLIEKSASLRAAREYIEIFDAISSMDTEGGNATFCREELKLRYPINRLSLMLERNAMFLQSLRSITWFLNRQDPVGITRTDDAALTKRYNRLAQMKMTIGDVDSKKPISKLIKIY